MNFSVAEPMLKNQMQPHHRDLFDRINLVEISIAVIITS